MVEALTAKEKDETCGGKDGPEARGEAGYTRFIGGIPVTTGKENPYPDNTLANAPRQVEKALENAGEFKPEFSMRK